MKDESSRSGSERRGHVLYNASIIAGVLISIIYSELTGLSAGLIVPGYLALSLSSPVRVITTLAVAAAAAVVCRLCSHLMILYGRRRFAFLILITFLISAVVNMLPISAGKITVIGVLIPGIIAREFDRQGFALTFVSIIIVTAVLALLMMAAGYPVFGN